MCEVLTAKTFTFNVLNYVSYKNIFREKVHDKNINCHAERKITRICINESQ